MSENRSTPRVAESLDDLTVGQWVAVGVAGAWSAWKITEGAPTPREPEGALSTTQILLGHAGNTVVILADPPAPPAPDWLVPADTMETLRGALDNVKAYSTFKGTAMDKALTAARAVRDAATEVQR